MIDQKLARRIKDQQMGRLMFALKRGGMFGLVLFVLTNLFAVFKYPVADLFFSARALMNLFAYVMVGILFYGSLIWWINEKVIAKELNNKN